MCLFQRIEQEYSSNIHEVDIVNSSDVAHFIVWKREGILAPYVPEDVAKFYPDQYKDADGMYAGFRAWGCVMGYKWLQKLVKPEDAPEELCRFARPKMVRQDREGTSGI